MILATTDVALQTFTCSWNNWQCQKRSQQQSIHQLVYSYSVPKYRSPKLPTT